MAIGFHNVRTLPGRASERPNWRNQAACLGMDPDLFYDRASIPLTTVICRVCPVRRDCLADVMAMPKSRRNVGQVRAGQWFGDAP